jgi:hypothetical protein
MREEDQGTDPTVMAGKRYGRTREDSRVTAERDERGLGDVVTTFLPFFIAENGSWESGPPSA